jgi:hypothetical protein
LVFIDAVVNLRPVPTCLCPPNLDRVFSEWVNDTFQPSIAPTQYHLPNIIQTVVSRRRYTELSHRSVDIFATDYVKASQLMVQRNHEELLLRSELDYSATRWYKCFPLGIGFRTIEWVLVLGRMKDGFLMCNTLTIYSYDPSLANYPPRFCADLANCSRELMPRCHYP